jgi:hypothetical protein
MRRFNAPLEAVAENLVKAHLGALPEALRERLEARGFEGTKRLSFAVPGAAGAELVTRNHPLPATLAETLLEGTLEGGEADAALGRAGAWRSGAVSSVVTVVLLRLRFKLTVHARRERLLVAEEAGALAFTSGVSEPIAVGAEALAFLEHPASGDIAESARRRILRQARERIDGLFVSLLEGYAGRRAEELSLDHERVRRAAAGVSRVSVEPVLPVDIIGFSVILPEGA